MDSDAEMMARHSGMLADIAAWAHDLAGDLHARALAAEEPAERAAFGRAFHDVARSLRQSVALEVRIRRDVRRLERETEAAEAPRRRIERDRRKTAAREALNRLAWTEYEPFEDFNLREMIGDMVDEAALEDDFADGTVEALIERLEARLHEVMDEHAQQSATEAAEEAAERAAERAAAEASFQRDPWAGGDRNEGWPLAGVSGGGAGAQPPPDRPQPS